MTCILIQYALFVYAVPSSIHFTLSWTCTVCIYTSLLISTLTFIFDINIVGLFFSTGTPFMTCTLRTPSWLIYNSQSVGKLTRTVWWQQPFYRTHSYQKDIALETLVLKNHVSEFCGKILKLSCSFLCFCLNNLLLFFSFCIY